MLLLLFLAGGRFVAGGFEALLLRERVAVWVSAGATFAALVPGTLAPAPECGAVRAGFGRGRIAVSSSCNASAAYTASRCMLGSDEWQPVKPKFIEPA